MIMKEPVHHRLIVEPYGGFSNYCDTAHLSQDNTVFDSLAIAAPHYKNYAGLEAYPATGCENTPATLATRSLGHDDVAVDPETGQITWDTSNLSFGRGFYIRIKCSNYDGYAFASMVVHADKSGTSQLRVAGLNGVSPYIGVAGRAMNSGDTIVFPDGTYPVSVSGDASYENAYKMNSPTAGSSDQFSTIIAETPGGVLITGAAQPGIPKQKNAFQLTSPNNIAIVGFVVKDIKRESLTATGGNRILIDFVGAAGAG